jgi:hypothetical protein
VKQGCFLVLGVLVGIPLIFIVVSALLQTMPLLAFLAILAGLSILVYKWYERRRIGTVLNRPGLDVAEPLVSEETLNWAFREFVKFKPVTIKVSDRTAYINLLVPGSPESRGGLPPGKLAGRQAQELADAIVEMARSAVNLAFSTVSGLERIVVSLYRPATHETLGHSYNACVLSAEVDRHTWSSIVQTSVSATNAFRNFPFRFRQERSFRLPEVSPFPGPHAANSALIGSSVEQMSPLEFEVLVKDLLQRLGWRAETTKPSHDGGIDVIAVNDEPLTGGRMIVQCKRYTGVVGSPAVRELAGAATHAHAKGVLITTSYFSADALKFAEETKLELIDGDGLRRLLRQHGLLL